MLTMLMNNNKGYGRDSSIEISLNVANLGVSAISSHNRNIRGRLVMWIATPTLPPAISAIDIPASVV